MTKKEKYKIALAECQKVAPKIGNTAYVIHNTTITHSKQWFTLHIKPSGTDNRKEFIDFLEHDFCPTTETIDNFLIALHREDIVAIPTVEPLEQLLNDLEALKQLPDDTTASYIKGQLSESLERYFAKRN